MSPFDRSKYPDDWEEISRRIKERAGWRCECTGECGHDHHGRCNLEHNTYTQGVKIDEFGIPNYYIVILTTAHLDHTPENCEDTNLKAMCQGCHLRYDAPRKKSERLARAAGTSPLF